MSLSKDAVVDLLTEMEMSTAFAGPVLYPDRFTRPFDSAHEEIFKIIDRKPGDEGYRPHKCIIAPRGAGKTSIAGLLVPSVAILLQRYSYIIIIGHNAGDAEEKTEELKRHLLDSDIVRSLYGDIKTDKWSQELFDLQIGSKRIRVQPRGSGQPVRGRLFGDDRPGLILVDDLEKTEETDSPDQRRKKKSWLNSDVLNSIDRGLKHSPGDPAPWEIIIFGTILHQDSLLINLHEDPYWDSILLEICDDSFVSNFPNFLSDQECREIYQHKKQANELDTGWFMDYRNNPVATGADAAFQSSFYRYYDEVELNLNMNHNVENLVIVDPSRTANFSSAPSGIVGVGVDTRSNKIYVRDTVSKRLHYDQLFDEIAEMIHRIQARVLAVEVTGLHEFVTYPLKTFLSARGINIEFVELQARQGRDEKGKAARVRELVPFYRQGVIFHNQRVCDGLEQQLSAFPRAKDWSLMDPLGYIVELLEKGQRYLSFPGQHEMRSESEVERQFKELEASYAELEEYAPLDDFRIFE